MQIQKTNTQNNQTFGLLYTAGLSSEHMKLIQPIFPKLAKIGKYVDIYASTQTRPIKQKKDYEILMDCIEFVSNPRTRIKAVGKSATERIFPLPINVMTESQLKSTRDDILFTAYKAAKESLKSLKLNA